MKKTKDYVKMSYAELDKELIVLKDKLMEERLKLKLGTKDDKKNQIKNTKKDIARIMTVISIKKREELAKNIKK